MMKFIGIGAGGNKAVIELIKQDVVERKDVMLLNSTLDDIPAEYRDIAHKFGSGMGGCGQERPLSKQYMLESLRNEHIDLDSFIDPTDRSVVIVSTTEGGSGSGSANLVAQYYTDMFDGKLNVHVIGFTGFEEDPRKIGNTVEFVQELEPEYTIQMISNKKFLAEVNNNPLKAEKLANKEFVTRVRILMGQSIVYGENNADNKDLDKTINTPGFMTIESVVLDRHIKSVDDFNKLLTKMLNESKSIDLSSGCQRMCVIMNVSERTQDVIDFNFNTVKEKVGFPIETFKHVQHEGETEFINFIIAGLRVPIEEIKDIHERYQRLYGKVTTEKDPFFSSDIKNLKIDTRAYDVGREKSVSSIDTSKKKNQFFDKVQVNTTPEQQSADNEGKAKKKLAVLEKISIDEQY